MAEGLGANFFLTSGTWKPAPGLLSHPELWVVMTVAGFTFVDLDGFTPVQAWNSCLEQNTSQPCTGSPVPSPDPSEASALALCFWNIPDQCPLLRCCFGCRCSFLPLQRQN